MKKFNVDWQSITSSSDLCELERLQYYCDMANKRGNDWLAIEIGSYQGSSAALLSEWFSTVICIDPWGEEETVDNNRIASFTRDAASNQFIRIFMENMEKRGLFNRVIPIVGTSKVLERLPYLGAGLIFVDDGHVYSACSEDIRRSLPHLKPNGILVCHDYKRPGFGYPPYDPNHPHHGPVDPYIGVQQAVDEAIIKYDLEVIDHYEGIIALSRKETP